MLLAKLSSCGRRRVAEQDRQHQHAAVQDRHHDRRPALLHASAPLGPQFGCGQRRIDRDDAGADASCAARMHPWQRHDGGDPGDRARAASPGQIGLAAVEHARGIPDHAAGHEADRIQRQRQRVAERAAGRGSRARRRPRRADRRCPTISAPGCSPACRRTAAWRQAWPRPWWQRDKAWRYRATWAHPSECDATGPARIRKCISRHHITAHYWVPRSNSVCPA